MPEPKGSTSAPFLNDYDSVISWTGDTSVKSVFCTRLRWVLGVGSGIANRTGVWKVGQARTKNG